MQSAEQIIKQADPTSGGGSVNYYSVCVEYPQHCPNAYVAECEDIIEALGLTFDEACIFKEIWRTANARKGNGKKGHTFIRAAEKIYHYASRILVRANRLREQ